MRRKDREIKEFDEIISVLDKCKVLHLAMISEGNVIEIGSWNKPYEEKDN